MPVACVAADLRDRLVDEINAELAALLPEVDGKRQYQVQARYMPRSDRQHLDKLHASIYIEATSPEYFGSGHEGDEDDHTISIALQQAVPTIPTAADGTMDFDAVDNTAFGDSMMDLAESIKALWRPATYDTTAGRLRNADLADCSFIELSHDPPFEPVPLIRLGIFTIILSVTYRHGH